MEETFDENMQHEDFLEEIGYMDCSDYSGLRSLVPAGASGLEDADVSEEIRYSFTFDWNVLFHPKRLHPLLEELFYWRDTAKTGYIFASGFLLLLAIDRCSIICVVPFLLLQITIASVACRMYRSVLRAADTNNNQNNIFEENKGLDLEWVKYENLVLKLPRDKVHFVTGYTVERINDLIGLLKNLFLFKNPNDSMHFGLFLISLAALGKMVNGTTLLLLLYIFVFTVPKFYELNKRSVDAKFAVMRKNLITMVNTFRVAFSNDEEEEEEVEEVEVEEVEVVEVMDEEEEEE